MPLRLDSTQSAPTYLDISYPRSHTPSPPFAGQKDIALAALKRLAVAGEVEGALKPKEHRALSLRLASHGERARLAVQSNALISAGQGREAAVAAALLGVRPRHFPVDCRSVALCIDTELTLY
jgi:hypothetical protein